MSQSLLTAEDLGKDFSRGNTNVHAVDSVSLELAEGDFVALHGPSGCGKSTLLLMAGALLTPDRGTVLIEGTDPYRLGAEERSAFRGKHVGFVFQQFHLIPYLDVLDNVLVGELAGGSNLRARARELLDEFQLANRIGHTPSALSVGEQQRVALARALLRSPRLILADEPTGNLDAENSEILLRHLTRYTEDGGAVLMATHDREAREAAKRSIEMAGGKMLAPA